MAYTTLTGDPTKGAVPPGEYNILQSLASQWEALTGFAAAVPDWALLEMANEHLSSLQAFGQHIANDIAMGSFANAPQFTALVATQPWAMYGLDRTSYQSLATSFGTEYTKLTGQAIPPDQLAKAFQSSQTGAGGLLSGSEYNQQLMNDANIQKTYGWVKYGLDYNAFQQQKLTMKQAFGNTLTDQQAVTQLQYFHANQGANMAVHQQTASPGQNQPKATGTPQSVVR